MTVNAGYGPVANTNDYDTATIALSGTTSTVIDTEDRVIGAINIPSAFTGTTITLQTSRDNLTFRAVRKSDASADLSIAVAASKHIILDPAIAYNLNRYVKIVSGSSEGAARSIEVDYARY